MEKHPLIHENTGKGYAAGVGGFRTYDLETARALHESQGGFLLVVGDNPPLFVVADESEAKESWGRTVEQLRDLETMHESAEA